MASSGHFRRTHSDYVATGAPRANGGFRRNDMTWKRSSAVGAIMLLSAIACGAVKAQTHALADAQQLENIRTAVIKVIGTRGDRVEVLVSGNILAIARVNSAMNQTGHAARDSEASRIAAAVAKTIAGNPEFENIHTIRVRYVNRARSGTHGRVIDTVDFRKDPSGAFVFHAT